MPFLRTYPSVRIWQVNASAEDVYSLSILLEEDLPRRTRVYATSIHEALVEQARTGAVPTERMGKDAGEYRRSGGRKALSDYFHVTNGTARLSPGLLDRVVFASHNVASDAPFNHFHVILARDLLRTFDASLRERVYRCFHESLLPLGFLGLGPEDRLRESPVRKAYRPIDKAVGLHQKVRE
jgi:chemotaxis protein methyltransferase CheR